MPITFVAFDAAADPDDRGRGTHLNPVPALGAADARTRGVAVASADSVRYG